MLKRSQFTLLIVVFILSVCGVSKTTLQQEAQDVTGILNSWQGKSVENFLKANSQVVESLSLGGGKVRYAIIHTPRSNYEYYVIAGRYRYYLLYVYVSELGIIYATDYKIAYRQR